MLQCDGNGFWYDGVESLRWNERCLQACQHSDAQVSNGTEKKCVESVVKSESSFEGEASSPLYRSVLGIIVFGLCGV
jgi:hypothetical protein